jgi:subtilisin family serine protease
MLRSYIILFSCLLFSNFCNAQSYPVKGWYLMGDSNFKTAISANETYKDLLNEKPSTPVIVAVLDTGVDIDHEDLKDVMWVNLGEVAENGLDDDKNGYVDDIHGWNFIGGADGTNVHYDSYEATRIYAKLKYKYENAVRGKLDKRQVEEYDLFQAAKQKLETELDKAQRSLNEINELQERLFESLHAVKNALNGAKASDGNLDTLNTLGNQNLYIGIQIMKNINAQLDTIFAMEKLMDLIEQDFELDKEPGYKKVNYGYNVAYNPREIVGDNYEDSSEMYYGNNDVEGPFARHGTHVAGIIGASRNNDIGMDGVADNVRIMSVRMLPDGDERDKDVANAIRYAVDNGASIINMSFGKGFSWDKQVVDDALRYAEKKDVLLVHASGNATLNLDSEPNFPNDTFEKPKGFLFCKKKEAKNWIEVGALSWMKGEEMVAPFSNYGKENVDIFAPGMGIYATTPDDSYEMLNGTSMASPVVAGAAAILRSYFPGLKAEQVKEILMKSSDPILSDVIKPGTEDSMIPFAELSKSGGILNIYNAVTLAAKTKGKKKIKNIENVKA